MGPSGTVWMPERRRHAIAPRFRSTAASRHWSPIPKRHAPFSQGAIQACSRAASAARRLTTPAERLTRTDRQFVDTLSALAPEIRTAAGDVNEFHRIARDAAAFEAQLNRLKMLKRQMYGRAEFDLLRSRVLHAA
jgi:transposase